MLKNEDNQLREGCISSLEEMRGDVLIREASEDDLPPVLSLYAQLGMDDGVVLSEDNAKNIFKRMKAYPDYTLYVAVYGATIVGSFALLIMDNLGHKGAPSGVVEDVIVHYDWRGKGIGRTMMKEAMSLCATKGCYKLALTSNKLRHNAHLFYKTLGFEVQGLSYSIPIGLTSISAGSRDEIESGALS
jgi:GNAT superfamily N-acetyltransferase